MTIVNMTPKRIEKALAEAGISLDGLTINQNEVEIYVCNKRSGNFSREKTEKKTKAIAKLLGWGGFSCASGAWVLQKGYRDMGDWNDRSSKWHY